MEILYQKGEYTPLSLEAAIKQAKTAVELFEINNIKILKVGLHPSDELCSENKIIAGPFHPSFRELVLSDLWLDKLLKTVSPSDKKITIRVPYSAINYAIGYNSCNVDTLKKYIGNIKIKPDANLTKNEIAYSYH
ncbi:MAG: hypothetical protein IPO21_08660 [Bacteroidales bacterium]|nr:hypothetical protein [Bacteroidales bacterium]